MYEEDITESSEQAQAAPTEKVYHVSMSTSVGRNAIAQRLTDLTFRQFADAFREPIHGGKMDGHFVRGVPVETNEHITLEGKHCGPGRYRADRYIDSADFLIVDGDKGLNGVAPPVLLVHEALVKLNLNHFIYTSYSHTADAPRWRAVIEGYVPGKDHLEGTVRKLVDEINATGDLDIAFANENKVWSQAWYLNFRDDPDDGLYEFYEYHDGGTYQYVNGVDKSRTFEMPLVASENATPFMVPNSYAHYLETMLTTGEGHTCYTPMAMILANQGIKRERIYEQLQPICKHAFETNGREWDAYRDSNLKQAITTAISKCAAGINRDALHDLVRKTKPYETPEDNSRPERHKGFKIIPITELLRSVGPVDYLIDNVLQSRALAQLIAPGGHLKSFVALDFGLSIASGNPWLGHDIKAPGGVIYIAGEGFDGLSNRVQGWCTDRGVDPACVAFGTSNKAAALVDTDMFESLVHEIIANVNYFNQRIRLIVVDTLARNFGGGDENSTRDMGLFVQSLDAIADLFDCTVLVVHHTPKSDAGIGRGSVALNNATDSGFLMNYEKSTGLVTLTNNREKDREADQVITLTRKVVPVIVDGEEVGTTLVLNKATIADKRTNKSAVHKLLEVGGIEGYADWVVPALKAIRENEDITYAALMGAAGKSRTTIASLRAKLVKNNYCIGKKLKLTKAGKSYIDTILAANGPCAPPPPFVERCNFI